MKNLRILASLLSLLLFSFTIYSQVEDEEVQFSVQGQAKLTRSTSTKQVLDFGTLKNEQKILKIEINNTGKNNCKIGCISIPEGVGVIVLKEVIKPGEKGVISVMIDPKNLKSGELKKELSITAITEKGGKTSTKTQVYNIKGQIL